MAKGTATVYVHSLLENLALDQAVCIHDYSEGYACRFQDEIQSQYFDVNKVSLRVTINYSLQAFLKVLRWMASEHRRGTNNLWRAFVCDLWWRHPGSWLCPSHPEVNFKAFRRIQPHYQEKCMNSQMDVQDSTRAGTVMVTCHVPWQLLDTQSSETTLPPSMQRENKMLLAPMSNRRQPQQFTPGKPHYQAQKIFVTFWRELLWTSWFLISR